MTNLGTLPEPKYSNNSSYATDINNSGQIVGYADDAYGGRQAFLYSNG